MGLTRGLGRRRGKSASQSVQEVAAPLGVVRPSRAATQLQLADQQISVARPARHELGQSSLADRGRDVGAEQMRARQRNVEAFGDKDLVARRCFVQATVGVSRLGVPVQDQCQVGAVLGFEPRRAVELGAQFCGRITGDGGDGDGQCG